MEILAKYFKCHISVVCVAYVQSLSCVQLCGHKDCSPPGSSVHRIFQARILELVAFSSSRGSSWPEYQTWVSCISCIGMQIFYYQLHLGSPHISVDPLLIIFFFAFSTFAFIHVQVRSLFNIFLTNSLHCLFFFFYLIINIIQVQLMITFWSYHCYFLLLFKGLFFSLSGFWVESQFIYFALF